LVTDVGSASLLLGAGTASNSQCIVVGDGAESHGARSVTAGSFWSTGSGFFGNGAGLTNLVIVGGDLGALQTNGSRAMAATLDLGGHDLVGIAGDVWFGGGALNLLDKQLWNFGLRTFYDSYGGPALVIDDAWIDLGPRPVATRVWDLECSNTIYWLGVPLTDIVFSNAAAFVAAPTNTGTAGDVIYLAPDGGRIYGAPGVAGRGRFDVVAGTQLVFVAGAVTNVLDADIAHR